MLEAAVSGVMVGLGCGGGVEWDMAHDADIIYLKDFVPSGQCTHPTDSS